MGKVLDAGPPAAAGADRKGMDRAMQEIGLRTLAAALKRLAIHPSFDALVGVVSTAYLGFMQAVPDHGFLLAGALLFLMALDNALASWRAKREGKFLLSSWWKLTLDKSLKYAGVLAVTLVAGLYGDVGQFMATGQASPDLLFPAHWSVLFTSGALLGLGIRELGSVFQHTDAVFDGGLRDLVKPARGILVLLEQLRQAAPTPTEWDPVRQPPDATAPSPDQDQAAQPG